MNIYGVRGYPTPDFTDERHCRTFAIPNTTIALAAFMGAIWVLTDPQMWQQYGDMTPEEAAAQMQDVIWQAYAEDEGICPVAEAPYWDTAANVDDTLPVDSETWYGQIVPTPALLESDDLTFLDNLGIWAIAGFIAYAGQPGAAIAFVPVAKRFVLAFKQHDLGSIVKVLIDFAEVAEIDTHGVGDAILNLNIVMPDDDDPHTLYVMVDEDNPEGNFAQIVRKELSEAEVSPPNLRWNPDTNTVQQTPDGGTTWVDNPSADPRSGSGFQLPSRGGDDPRCDAAENMVVKLKSMVNIFEQEIAQLQALNALFDVILLFLPEVGIVLQALLAVTEFLLTLGSSAISAAFTDDQWDIIKCVLYCDIADDGTVNQAQFDKVLDDLHVQASTVVYDVIYTIFTLSLGVNGVSNAGATGDAAGDCSACDCGWCHRDDLTSTEGEFTAAVGSYSDGWIEGFVNGAGCSTDATYTYLDMSRVLPDGVYRKIFFTIELEKGVMCEDNTNVMHVTAGGGEILEMASASAQPDGTHDFTWTGTLTDPGTLRLVWVCGEQSGSSNPGGTIRVISVQYEGTGDIPDGFDQNC